MRKAFYPRALYAIALIALGVFVAVVSGWLFAWLGSGFGGTSIGRSTGSTVVLADAINPGEGILSLDPDKVLGGWGDWQSLSDDGVIAGCVLSGNRVSAFGEIESLLEEKGWRAVPSGQEAISTFIKGEGEYRWLMVSYETVGASTSVVVNARSANG